MAAGQQEDCLERFSIWFWKVKGTCPHHSQWKSCPWPKPNALSVQDIYFPSTVRGRNILCMWMRLENTYSGYLWESTGREGAVLRGWALWYLRTQRLVVHFKRWQGGNMLSGWHCKCREFACLCAALPQDTEAEKSEVFSPVNSMEQNGFDWEILKDWQCECSRPPMSF